MTNGVVGQRIEAIRPATYEECRELGWNYDEGEVFVLALENGGTIFPASDESADGPGHLIGIIDGRHVDIYEHSTDMGETHTDDLVDDGAEVHEDSQGMGSTVFDLSQTSYPGGRR